MTYKWIGALLIITGCGGFGFSAAVSFRQEERNLRQLIHILELMEWELQYRLTTLPDLCRQAGKESSGIVKVVFLNLSREMQWQTAPDVRSCMSTALQRSGDIPSSLRRHLVRLSQVLGRFDLAGQIHGLQSVRRGCEDHLRHFAEKRDNRIKSYRTLGLCAGAALAILFA